jgi:phosphoribosylamine--glycine ligase
LKILLVGGGGREHALAWKLAQSPLLKELVWTPGNGAFAPAFRREAVPAEDTGGLMALARSARPDLVVVGPEIPLAAGLADRLGAEGIPCFGPKASAARLESSKTFAKEFCIRHSIPTAQYRVFTEAGPAIEWARAYGGPFPVVLKADGLAAGKGVLICANSEEVLAGIGDILVSRQFGEAGDRLVAEEFLQGEEASLLAFCDGEKILMMPPARDYKKAFDGDAGPNTGGMGAFCPTAHVPMELARTLEAEILTKVVRGMAAEGNPFQGILYAGLMLTPSGPKVLEFNCRFGDPETQVVLPRMEGDLLPILAACAAGDLGSLCAAWRDEAALTVSLCSDGYPGKYTTGHMITGLDAASESPGTMIFHAGTRRAGDGRVLTNGGRVLNVTALAPTLSEARDRAYEAVGRIAFLGMRYRTDIGAEWGKD